MFTSVCNKRRWALWAVVVVIVANGCADPEPVRIGFVGGLSGRVSDLGGPARNGMLLAVEQANAEGGIDGRPIEAIIRDDKQDVEVARKAVRELLDANVEAIIGPATSSMATSVVDLANAAKVVMVGATVTSNELSIEGDYFIRVLSPTSVHAAEVASFFTRRGFSSFTAIFDSNNSSYTESWLRDFSQQFESDGGHNLGAFAFSSERPEDLIELPKKALQANPEFIVFITNSVDAALLAKQVRMIDSEIQIATSEWAGTERLIQLGGRHIENAYVPQYLDRESEEPRYLTFRQQFKDRFNQEPGFPGVAGYNATQLIITALREKPEKQPLRDYILERGEFPGLQWSISLNPSGDPNSKTSVTRITDGRFVVQDDPH
ncbi:MAG: amino acid ABC transporter substrate-binding protein [Lysobacteraceae bacterium]|nr:MAG: amino acid ABC transporter substrate-binding protein [Xanthomonadaceae bacterium]